MRSTADDSVSLIGCLPARGTNAFPPQKASVERYLTRPTATGYPD